MTYVILLGMFVHNKKSFLLNLLLVGLLVSVVLVSTTVTAAETTDETTTLESVEITEYEGEDLSSIDAFRENSIKGPQYIDEENYTLAISGLVNNELHLTYDEVIDGHPNFEKVVKLDCVEGWSVTILWKGVLVNDLIEAAGVNPNANTVIFYAYDGYSTSMPLDYIIDNDILMAHKMNNVTLPPARGFPFQLVAESKWGYKWIKWVTEIELSDDEDYRGFWESRGYSNDGDLDKHFFDSQVPEFSSMILMSVLIAIIVITAIIYRKKMPKKNLHQPTVRHT
jgi:DMSO/TMAO reductase YedYZ molybdopterin-dependent catalytic subunit